MAIRWKLFLSIGTPLVLLLTVLLIADHRRLRETAYLQASERIAELAERYAASFDGELRAIAQVSRSTAALLELRDDLSEAELYELLRRNVESDPLIYGSCIAFEPGAFVGAHAGDAASASPLPVAEGPTERPDPRLFCPYVFRGERGLVRMDVADAYDYLDPKWEWFNTPRQTLRPFWTEPFFDDGAGNVEMVTFVSPFLNDGRFRGTVNVDVRLDDLRPRAMRDVDPKVTLYCLSSRGTFIIWHDAEISMDDTIFTIAERFGRPEIADLGERMIAGERGSARVRDLTSDLPYLAFFAPIPTAGWSLASVMSEEEVMAPVYAALKRRAFVGVSLIAMVVVIVMGMSTWIIRPVGKLAEAVNQLSAGNLSAAALGVTSRDEIGQLAIAFNSMVEQLRSHIEALTRETTARQAVEAELQVARAIQSAMLPQLFPPFPDRSEFDLHAVSAPARYVGGDFYDYFFISDDVMTVVIADVSGKGVPAALFMAVTRTIIRDVALNAGGEASPAAVMARTNDTLLREDLGGFFVTLFIAQYNTKTGEIQYANGGHPPPYRIDNHGDVHTFGEVTGTIVGVLDEQTFENRLERLLPGERLVLFTDGVPDARCSNGSFYGSTRFEASLAECRNAQARSTCEELMNTLNRFQAEEPHDDITLVVLGRVH